MKTQFWQHIYLLFLFLFTERNVFTTLLQNQAENCWNCQSQALCRQNRQGNNSRENKYVQLHGLNSVTWSVHTWQSEENWIHSMCEFILESSWVSHPVNSYYKAAEFLITHTKQQLSFIVCETTVKQAWTNNAQVNHLFQSISGSKAMHWNFQSVKCLDELVEQPWHGGRKSGVKSIVKKQSSKRGFEKNEHACSMEGVL